MIVWVGNAPMFDPSSESSTRRCHEFIDSLITCKKDQSIDELISYQHHKHSFTCRKSSKMNCRFGIPFFPMRETVILQPIDDNDSKDFKKKSKKLCAKIRDDLTQGKYKDLSELLTENSITYEEYVDSIRATIKRPKVFLKRRVNECNINAYNKTLLEGFEANMDIQFIVDAYACVAYIIDYINKSNRGMSILMRNLVKQLDYQKVSIRDKLKTLASKFINAAEISAQEAAYHILELPLSKGSRSVIYINTGRPEERVRMLKSKGELMKLDQESEDVFHHNIVDHYTKRPLHLEDMCLADFAAKYNFTKTLRKRMTEKLKEKYIPLIDKSGYITERSVAKVIRYRKYSLELEPLEYWRENIMLFAPWRDEENEILRADIQELFIRLQNVIEANKEFYHRTIMDEDEEKESVTESDESTDEEGEFEVYRRPDDLEACVGNDTSKIKTGVPFRRTFAIESDFKQMVSELNDKQYRYLISIWNRMNSGTQVNDFLTGGAGTGKSKLIMTLAAAIDRFHNVISTKSEACSIRTLICAPTGKSAHNISGLTLHTAFSLPVSQNRAPFYELSADKLNTLRCKLHGLKFLIIDEISMVGATLFEQTESRLRQLFDRTKPFGGISVIAAGDFTQLRPVCDSYVFEGSKRSPYYELAHNALWQSFKIFELNEIMRQKDDIPFAQALQNYATCELAADDLELFRSRVVEETPKECIHLYSTRKEVEDHNRVALKKIDAFTCESEAHDTCYGPATEAEKKGYLKSLKTAKTEETCGLSTSLTLKLTAKYMITDNLDVEDGLVNGAIGELVYITLDETKSGAVIAWIRFDDPRTGRKARIKYRNVAPNEQPNAVPVLKLKKLISNKGYHKQLQMYRSQFPLVPAEAITIHKSQGSTFKNVAYHVGKYVTHSSAYVALSRATSANGLFIIGQPRFFEKPNDVVRKELERLRERPAADEYLNLTLRSERFAKCVVFNVQSYGANFDAVAKDPCLNNADLICLVETWTVPEDIVAPPNFHVVGRVDSGCQRRPSGVLVLGQNGTDCNLLSVNCMSDGSSTLQSCTVLFKKTTYVVVVYIPPNSTLSIVGRFLSICLKSIPHQADIVIAGDFNCTDSVISHLMSNLFSSRKIKHVSSSDPSTYLKTQIDLTFSNTRCKHYYYHSLLSYHRPQILHLPRKISRSKFMRNSSRSLLSRALRHGMAYIRSDGDRGQRVGFCASAWQRMFVKPSLHHAFKDYLNRMLRKRNRLKFLLPQHKQRTVSCPR
jgi:PIF1-like helicase/Helicase